MKRPRKKYRHDPGKKWENPICRQAEAVGLAKWRDKHFAMMESYEDGSMQRDMIVTLADTIMVAHETMDGWEDPDGLAQVMRNAMGELATMHGFWRKSAEPLLREAVNIAIQVLNGMPVINTYHAQNQVSRMGIVAHC